jgi:transposase
VVIKKREVEAPKERCKRQLPNHLVYNDWGLYGFVQMLTYKWLRVGKELHVISEAIPPGHVMCVNAQRTCCYGSSTYRCENCGLVMGRDDNSAVNIYQRLLARPGPHISNLMCGVLHEQCRNQHF